MEAQQTTANAAESNAVAVAMSDTNQNLIAQRLLAPHIHDYHRRFIGDNFFSKDNMAFFKSKVDHGYFIPNKMLVIFITCEKSPTGNVGYTVRKFSGEHRKAGVVDVTEFNKLTREKAMVALQDAVNLECQHL